MDKRIENTKTKIKNGLIQLLRDHNILDITVSQLCEKSKVNRSTFYVHYSNVAECFEEITDGIIVEMEKQFSTMPVRTLESYLQVYFATARKHREIFGAIHATNIYNPMIEKMVRMNNQYLHSELSIPTDTHNLKFCYVLSGFYGMVEVWLRNGCRESDEELIEIMKELSKRTL